MNRFVQFVVCQYTGNGEKYLFYAPSFTKIEKGDEVLVDTKYGERKATVLAVCTTSSDDVDRILRVLTGVEDKPLKRVIGKYKFAKFEYGENETNE